MNRMLQRLDRRLAGLVSLTFAISLGESSIVPLLPLLKADYGLSGLETGAVLSATTLAMFAVSVPAGLLASRLGSRRLLTAAVVLCVVGMVGISLSSTLVELLVSRAVFGLAAGIVWTVAPVLAAAGGRGAGGTGWLIASGGAGWLVGPMSAGLIAEAWGVGAPFLVIGLVVAPLVLVPLRDRSAEPLFMGVRLRSAVSVARRERSVGGATLAISLLGVATGVSGLLAPLALAANGLSVGAIGVVIGLSAVVFTVCALGATRLSTARIDVRLVGTAVVVMAAAWAIPAVSLSTAAVVAFLLLSAACRALLNTVVYALARTAIDDDALAAPVTGVMNAAWGAMALATPIAAGLAVGGTATRVAFALTALAGFAAAAWMLAPVRAPASPLVATT